MPAAPRTARRAYSGCRYPDPGYVRMAAGALGAWARLQADAGEQLLVRTGGLDAGPGAMRCAAALADCGVEHSWLPAGPGARPLPRDRGAARRAHAVPARLRRLPGRAGGRGAAAAGPARRRAHPGPHPGARHRAPGGPGRAAHPGGRDLGRRGGDHRRAVERAAAGRGARPRPAADGDPAAGALLPAAAGAGAAWPTLDRMVARGPDLVCGADGGRRARGEGGGPRSRPGRRSPGRALRRDRSRAGGPGRPVRARRACRAWSRPGSRRRPACTR